MSGPIHYKPGDIVKQSAYGLDRNCTDSDSTCPTREILQQWRYEVHSMSGGVLWCTVVEGPPNELDIFGRSYVGYDITLQPDHIEPGELTRGKILRYSDRILDVFPVAEKEVRFQALTPWPPNYLPYKVKVVEVPENLPGVKLGEIILSTDPNRFVPATEVYQYDEMRDPLSRFRLFII